MFMRDDLQSLEISKRELRRLCGVKIERMFRPVTSRHITATIAPYITWTAIAWAAVAAGLAFNFGWKFGAIAFIVAFGLNLKLIFVSQKIKFSKDNVSLVKLLDDIDRYNDVIKSIHINDQIEDAGNPEVGITDREKVVEALHFTKTDLVRALKTEKILRENKHFIARNPELFANNLTALTALQVSDRASEHGRLLNEALQIAVSAQEEMRKLKQQHS